MDSLFFEKRGSLKLKKRSLRYNQTYSMIKKAFITGATGLLGGNLAKYLLELNFEVYALRRTEKSSLHLSALNIQWINGDLNQLSEARNATEIAANKKQKVFETSFDWKCCDSDKFIEQKLQYIHSNPCKGKWNLAISPIDYLHCSAKYYLTGEQRYYEVLNYKLLTDIRL